MFKSDEVKQENLFQRDLKILGQRVRDATFSESEEEISNTQDHDEEMSDCEQLPSSTRKMLREQLEGRNQNLNCL